MTRTRIICVHTFKQAISQPVYPVLLSLSTAVLCVLGLLPFFTLGDDAVMYRAVAIDWLLLTVLGLTLFNASQSVYEEIEDRTMLTLMSKPVSKLEVLVGKFAGLSLSALLATAILGLVATVALWYRIPGDYGLTLLTLDNRIEQELTDRRLVMLNGMVPDLIVTWLQVTVLAAVSVAISTRVSFIVNLPVVLLIYIAGNLTRFIPDDAGAFVVAEGVKAVLPFLAVFDLKQMTVFSNIAVPSTMFDPGDGPLPPNTVTLSTIWASTGLAGVYALMYCTFALAGGLLLFRSRELGGSE